MEAAKAQILVATETWLSKEIHFNLRNVYTAQSPYDNHQGVLILLDNSFTSVQEI